MISGPAGIISGGAEVISGAAEDKTDQYLAIDQLIKKLKKDDYEIDEKDKNILLIATKLSVDMNFIKKVKTAIRGLPRWLSLPEITGNNKLQNVCDN